jgi:DNA-binding CsgD family transcriptional regulator
VPDEPGSEAGRQERHQERQQEAARLRAAGLTYAAIGAQLGISHYWARQLVLRAGPP